MVEQATTTVVPGKTWTQAIAPVQTALAALAPAVVDLLAQGTPIPNTLGGWISLLASAAIGAGLLHVTAPRSQGGTKV